MHPTPYALKYVFKYKFFEKIELFSKNTREAKVPEYFKNKGGLNYGRL
jgi:hypothetical protein